MIRTTVIALFLALFALPASAQSWRVVSEDDPFDDRPNIRAQVIGRDYSAAVRCKAGLLEVLIMGGYIGEEDANVRYRFDDGEIHSDVWGASTSREGLFADAPGELARWMAAGSRMAFEYEDFADTPHQYSISLAGSGAAIGRVMDACGVPRTDPRSQDDTIWRRAVIDLDKLERDVVRDLQARFAETGWEVEVTGRRDLATYRALSQFYVGYWSLCEDGRALTSSCETWRSSRRYNADADYPKEPIALFIEFLREGVPESEVKTNP